MIYPEWLNLNAVWFVLVGVLFTGYALLDGFDLGVGALHLFTRKDEHRRIMLNAIGPVWDGNEVWLVTGGGALFAAFPNVYATVFSGFYLAFILLLFALIFRAVWPSSFGASNRCIGGGGCGMWASPWAASCPASSSAWRWATSPGGCRSTRRVNSPAVSRGCCTPTPSCWASPRLRSS